MSGNFQKVGAHRCTKISNWSSWPNLPGALVGTAQSYGNRPKTIVLQGDESQHETGRNVHYALPRDSLVMDLQELNGHPGSGRYALVGKVERKWQNTVRVMSFFRRQ